MKKLCLLISLLLTLALCLTSCNGAAVGISGAKLNENGELVLTLTDGTEQNVGKVTGEKGDAGAAGAQGPQGETGENGAPGADAIAPQIRVNEQSNEWEVSTDGGVTWVSTGVKATGEDGESATDENPQGLDFYLLPDGTYGVKAGKAMYLEEIVIPENYNGKPVTQVLDFAVVSGGEGDAGTSYLKKISLPNTITKIGAYAFATCTLLQDIIIPAGVTTTIGNEAFFGCSSLTNIEIPAGVTTIGDQAFGGCINLTTVTFGENSQLTSIGEYAFSYCSNLTSIEIPASVTEIGGLAFQGCNKLESITLPFVGASLNGTTNTSFAYIFGRYYDNSVPASLKTVVITGGATISDSAFSGCSNLTSIKIPAGVTTIGNSAFSGCRSLTSIEIPASVTEIGEQAFYYCSNLTSIEIPAGVTTTIGNEAFFGCSSLTSIELPAGVTSIGDRAFYNCSSLTSIELPAGVTSIGGAAFYSCSSLTTVTFAENSQLTSIVEYAFSYCSSLTSIEIPTSVTEIGSGVFSGCSSLTSIEIPAGVTSIGYEAFLYCSNLTTVYYGGSASDWAGISIDFVNDALKNATRYYYAETKPAADFGSYWHYVNGTPTVWGEND